MSATKGYGSGVQAPRRESGLGTWLGGATLLMLTLTTAGGAAQAGGHAADAPAPDMENERADTQARIHFEAGNEYFEVADFEAALREFERAYELSHRSQLLYNLYLSHERLGHLQEASTFLGRYLSEARHIEGRTVLEERLRTMRRRLEEEHAQAQRATETPAVTTPRETPAVTTPTETPPVTTPTETPPVTPATATGPTTPTAPAAPGNHVAGHSHSAVAITFWSLGAAALVSFGVSAVMARSANEEISNYCGAAVGRQCTGHEPGLDRLKRRGAAADFSLVATGVFMGTGLILSLLHRARSNVSVRASASHDSAQIALSGRF